MKLLVITLLQRRVVPGEVLAETEVVEYDGWVGRSVDGVGGWGDYTQSYSVSSRMILQDV